MYLRWLTFFISTLVGIGYFAFEMGVSVITQDVSKLSVVILLIYIGVSIFIGMKSYKKLPYDCIKTTDFAIEELPRLGLIGTIIGFIVLFSQNISGITITNEESVKKLIEAISLGMGTALWTTLFGVVSSLLLIVQKRIVINE